jgi:hypothetical protein
MKYNKYENGHDKSEKLFVIGITHTIIEPSAVMIEFTDTSIATSTVFCC